MYPLVFFRWKRPDWTGFKSHLSADSVSLSFISGCSHLQEHVYKEIWKCFAQNPIMRGHLLHLDALEAKVTLCTGQWVVLKASVNTIHTHGPLSRDTSRLLRLPKKQGLSSICVNDQAVWPEKLPQLSWFWGRSSQGYHEVTLLDTEQFPSSLRKTDWIGGGRILQQSPGPASRVHWPLHSFPV